MPAAIAIPAAMGAVGGLLQGKADKKAGQAMGPWGVNGLFGNVTYDQNGRVATANADAQTADIRNLLGNQAAGMLGGGGMNQFMQFAQGVGNQDIASAYGGLQGLLGQMPGQEYQNYQNQMQQAQGFANQDLQGLMSNNLNLLRQQAAPQEQQQYNSLQNRLFGQGRLGSSGGGMEIQRFARGLGEADLSRQMASQQLGIQAQNQNLAQAGLLGDLAGSGFANALNYNDIGVNRAGQRMQNAMGLFGFGNQFQQQQQQGALAGLQGMQGIDQNLMNLIALGKNISTSPQQAQMMNQSPLGNLLSGASAGMGGMMGGLGGKKGP